MKLTIKNLDQKSFVINTYGLKTVSDLKRKLYNVAVTNLLPERQQLLYAGRVLKDSKLLSSYSIDERKFLLVMARKPWRTSNPEEPIQQTSNNNNNNKVKWMTEKTGQKHVNIGQGDELNPKGTAKYLNEQRKVRIKTPKRKRNGTILTAHSSVHIREPKGVVKPKPKLQNKFKTTTSSSTSISHEDCRVNHKKRRDSMSSIESTDSQYTRRCCKRVKATTNSKPLKPAKSLLSTSRLRATKKASKMHVANRKSKSKKSAQNQVCDEHVLRRIVAMGYNEIDVRRALIASFNNPNEAVDYLIQQVQERVGYQTEAKQQQQQRQQHAHHHKTKTAEQTTSNQANALAFLRQDPDFKNLRRLLRKRPNVLQDVIMRIDETQPELLLMLKEHESEFLQLLHESSVESEDEQCKHCNYNAMHISPEEEKHISRLVRMGFKRQMVILAFIACDRNVERAVDYLCRIDDLHI